MCVTYSFKKDSLFFINNTNLRLVKILLMRRMEYSVIKLNMS